MVQDLWSFARIELGLSDADFWELTLRELHALTERFRAREQRTDWRFGLVAAHVLNVHLKPDADPFQPGDFFGWGQKKEDEDLDEGEIGQLMMAVAAMNKRLGGKDLRGETDGNESR